VESGVKDIRASSRPHQVIGPFLPETIAALRAMNRAFADVVIENHRIGLPVIQYLGGETVETPAESLLPQAQRLPRNEWRAAAGTGGESSCMTF